MSMRACIRVCMSIRAPILCGRPAATTPLAITPETT